MPAYRSLIGGFASTDPHNKQLPLSIRANNPGALNTANWLQALPGYVGVIDGTPGNSTAIFESPEQGVAAWLKLLQRYQAGGHRTIRQIISRYGGGQDYSEYLQFVVDRSKLYADVPLDLNDDVSLLKFARAMFRYEAGRESPLSDRQILYGFNLARNGEGSPMPATGMQAFIDSLLSLIERFFGSGAQVTVRQEPRWLQLARKDVGFREIGVNKGIERFIDGADGVLRDGKGVGSLGDPWCAIALNYWLEMSGVPGTRSAMARSFERTANFRRLDGPALGAIATFWRNSRNSGFGHANLYVGTVNGMHYGLGANQSDQVSVAPMDMSRHTGWWWPAGEPLPKIGAVPMRFLTPTTDEFGSET